MNEIRCRQISGLLIILLLTVFNKHAVLSQNSLCLEEKWINAVSFVPPEEWAQYQTMVEWNGWLHVVVSQFGKKKQLYRTDGISTFHVTEIPFSIGGISDMCVYKDELYIAGSFNQIQTIYGASGIAKWDGKKWNAVEYNKVGLRINCLEVYKGELYAGGQFEQIGSIKTHNVARYDGISWKPLGKGVWAFDSNKVVAMEVYKGELYIGGNFIFTDSITCQNITRWNGKRFSGLDTEVNAGVKIIKTFENNLFVFGSGIIRFGSSLPLTNNIGIWNGSEWFTGGLTGSDFIKNLCALEVNDGVLYGCTGDGIFDSNLNGSPSEGFIKFSNKRWELVTGIDKSHSYVMRIISYNDELYASGHIEMSCGHELGNLIKLCPKDACTEVSGKVFLDANRNCIYDSSEAGVRDQVITGNSSLAIALTDENGIYSGYVSSGSVYIPNPDPPPYYSVTCPSDGYTFLATTNTITDTINFGITADGEFRDLVTTLTLVNIPRPGFPVKYHLKYRNAGTVKMNGSVTMEHSSHLVLDSSSQPFASYNGLKFEWKFGDLLPLEIRLIELYFTIDPATSLGTVLKSSSIILPIVGDETPKNNVSEDDHVVVGSCDPNDKRVSPAGTGAKNHIPIKTKELEYIIRFQNTGTDTAFMVKVLDNISSNLDLSSIKTIASSHKYVIRIVKDRWIEWRFENILLADSNRNEVERHGFIRYRIHVVDNIQNPTEIRNEAEIYFDFNKPVITNTTLSTFFKEEIIPPKPDPNLSAVVYPNPFDQTATLLFNRVLDNGTVRIVDLRGRIIIEIESVISDRIQIKASQLSEALYLYEVRDSDGTVVHGKFNVLKYR